MFLRLFIFERDRERQRETERERQSVSGGGAEREGEPKQALQALSCQLRAWCGALTHELWDHDLSQSWSRAPNQLSHPGAPQKILLSPAMLFLIEKVEENNPT